MMHPLTLKDAARDVLENAAFLFCDEPPELLPALTADVVEARVRFEAPAPGALFLRLPVALAEEAAANLLGIEPGTGEAEGSVVEATGELLNMISSEALAAWLGAGARWTLGIPEASRRALTVPSEAAGAVVLLVAGVALELEVREGSA